MFILQKYDADRTHEPPLCGGLIFWLHRTQRALLLHKNIANVSCVTLLISACLNALPVVRIIILPAILCGIDCSLTL